jgi:hypothetical protein
LSADAESKRKKTLAQIRLDAAASMRKSAQACALLSPARKTIQKALADVAKDLPEGRLGGVEGAIQRRSRGLATSG